MVVDGLVSGHFVISQVFGEVGRNLHLLYYITGGVDATIAKHYRSIYNISGESFL